MPVFDKLKKLADQAMEKAGPVVADAKEKAGPLAAQAKVKAADLASKAAPVAAQGVDRASASLDKATKGKYSDKISGVHDKVSSTLQPSEAKSAEPKLVVTEPTEPVIVVQPTVETPINPENTAH